MNKPMPQFTMPAMAGDAAPVPLKVYKTPGKRLLTRKYQLCLELAAGYCRIPQAQIPRRESRRRTKIHVQARNIVCFLAFSLGSSFDGVAEFLGTNAATCCVNFRRFKRRLAQDENLAKDLKSLQARLKIKCEAAAAGSSQFGGQE